MCYKKIIILEQCILQQYIQETWGKQAPPKIQDLSIPNELIAKMDAQNAARREKVSKKALENAPLVAKVVEMLGTEPLTATDIAAALEVSPQKASALARIAVAQGAAASLDVKGPKGKCKGYVAC